MKPWWKLTPEQQAERRLLSRVAGCTQRIALLRRSIARIADEKKMWKKLLERQRKAIRKDRRKAA